MLPLFYRKRTSLKQEPALVTNEEWEEVGEKTTPKATYEPTVLADASEPVVVTTGIEQVVTVDEADFELKKQEVKVENAENTANNFNENDKLHELIAKYERLQAELDELKTLISDCPVCNCNSSGKRSIVIDVSRALDLMHDIFTTGMAYQHRIVTRVCDELCDFVEK